MSRSSALASSTTPRAARKTRQAAALSLSAAPIPVTKPTARKAPIDTPHGLICRRCGCWWDAAWRRPGSRCGDHILIGFLGPCPGRLSVMTDDEAEKVRRGQRLGWIWA
jgi:hypothetical protein